MNDAVLFPKLNDYQIECAIEAGEVVSLPDGEVIFREGEAAKAFYVVLEGKIKVTQRTNGDEAVLALHGPGDFTGTTELLTGGTVTATGWALGPTKVARVPVERFQQLIMACPEMRALLIPALTERRVTEFRIATQQQKLAALGKLSAGLAHELNNPASAARRSAQNLGRALGDVESLCCELLACVMSENGNGHGAALKGICDLAARRGRNPRSARAQRLRAAVGRLAGSAQSARAVGRRRLAGRRGDHAGRPQAAGAAHLRSAFSAHRRSWLAKMVEMRSLCHELDQSTSRMSEIVGAMKSYSHMDRAQGRAPTDLREGIETTLTILKHKLKKKDLKVAKDFAAVPRCSRLAGS